MTDTSEDDLHPFNYQSLPDCWLHKGVMIIPLRNVAFIVPVIEEGSDTIRLEIHLLAHTVMDAVEDNGGFVICEENDDAAAFLTMYGKWLRNQR